VCRLDARPLFESGRPGALVALAWPLSKPGIAASIVGATKPGHLQDAPDERLSWLLLPLMAQVGQFARHRSASARSFCSAISAFAALSTPEEIQWLLEP
jgi:aryl-alcohol dehydrogenase-like predicted oxidoreductase